MNIEKRDIILELNTCRYHRISEKLTYFPLQCPILFPYGGDSFPLDIPIGLQNTTGRKRKSITMQEFSLRIKFWRGIVNREL